jgi:hypothetical protein
VSRPGEVIGADVAEDPVQLRAASQVATARIASINPEALVDLGALVHAREEVFRASARAAEQADMAERTQRYRPSDW